MMRTVCLYATKTGVTEDIAFSLKTIKEMDVINIQKVHHLNLDDYDKVIIGASVRVGRVIKVMRHFVSKHQVELAKKKLGFFVSGADIKTNLRALLTNSYPDALVEKSSFMIHCGGEFRMEKLRPFSRWIIKVISKKKVQEGTPDPEVLSDAIETLKEAVKVF
jgi:menaquinone-dependent protoporphyrinogen oxidase